MLHIVKRSLIVDKDVLCSSNEFTHTSNPLLIKTSSVYRLYFNSRDIKNRSSVFSIDLDQDSLDVQIGSFREQYLIDKGTPLYCIDGVSLGDFDSSDFSIGFMGWKSPIDEHWVGEIGKLYLDCDYNVKGISSQPTLFTESEKAISFSYPAYVSYGDKKYIWYGTTLDWCLENGEMLHVLRRRKENENLDDFELPYVIGERQAFSRPTLLSTESFSLLAYSFRGSHNTYRIGLNFLDGAGIPINSSPDYIFYPSKSGWDSEMTEYPYLFEHNGKIFMLYNGNSYGKTGIGLAEIGF